MTARFCEVLGCTSQGKRSNCTCGMQLCAAHASSVRLHDCAKAKELERLVADPKAKREFLAKRDEHAWSAVVAKALNESGLGVFWQGKKRGASKVALRVPDVIGYALDGAARFCCVELKNTHGENCQRKACGCTEQRRWGELLNASGGVYLLVPALTDCSTVVEQVRVQLQQRREDAAGRTG